MSEGFRGHLSGLAQGSQPHRGGKECEARRAVTKAEEHIFDQGAQVEMLTVIVKFGALVSLCPLVEGCSEPSKSRTRHTDQYRSRIHQRDTLEPTDLPMPRPQSGAAVRPV